MYVAAVLAMVAAHWATIIIGFAICYVRTTPQASKRKLTTFLAYRLCDL